MPEIKYRTIRAVDSIGRPGYIIQGLVESPSSNTWKDVFFGKHVFLDLNDVRSAVKALKHKDEVVEEY